MTNLVAIGGGGFNREPENPRMENFVLGLTGKARPRVCFIPTASGDDKTYVVNFYSFFGSGKSDPSRAGGAASGTGVPESILGVPASRAGVPASRPASNVTTMPPSRPPSPPPWLSPQPAFGTWRRTQRCYWRSTRFMASRFYSATA